MSFDCPKCYSKTAVYDGRHPKGGDRFSDFRRRRRCTNKKCGHRFTTIEMEYEKVGPALEFTAQIKGMQRALTGAYQNMTEAMNKLQLGARHED